MINGGSVYFIAPLFVYLRLTHPTSGIELGSHGRVDWMLNTDWQWLVEILRKNREYISGYKD